MEDALPIRISFIYSKEDLGPYITFAGEANQKPLDPARDPLPAMFYVQCALVIIPVLLIALFGSKIKMIREGAAAARSIPPWALEAITALCILLLCSILLIVSLIRKSRMRFLSGQRGQTENVELSAEGINWQAGAASSHYDWSFFGGFSERGTVFRLIGCGGIIHILPKRAFTPGQLDVSRRLFIERIAPTHAAVEPPPY